MKNMSVSSLLKPVTHLLGRFHMTIFIVLVSAGLAGAVMILNIVLSDNPGTDGYTSSIGGGSIDQNTLQRITSLHTSDETLTPLTLPSGRVNPFAE